MQPVQILIVEDSAVVALALQDALRRLGYGEAAIAHSGPEAIDAALHTHPDLVLMDVKLDEAMDGIEAASAIRAEADVPVIYLTAYSDDQTLKRVLHSKAAGYIVKPFDLYELQSTVAKVLHQIGKG